MRDTLGMTCTENLATFLSVDLLLWLSAYGQLHVWLNLYRESGNFVYEPFALVVCLLSIIVKRLTWPLPGTWQRRRLVWSSAGRQSCA